MMRRMLSPSCRQASPQRIGIAASLAAICFVFPAIADTGVRDHKDWQVRVIVDEFTDDRQVVLNTKVEDGEEDFAGKRGIVLIRSGMAIQTADAIKDMLVLKCDGPGTPPYVVIITQDGVNRDGVRNIEFRVDKREMKRVLMTSHQKYLMIFDRRKAGRFIEQLKSAKLLIGRSHTMDGKKIEFRIPIDGFDDVEHFLYEHCSRS